MEKITLYFRQGSSDKVYQVSIEPSGDGYVVNFANGRRGSTLRTGTKTATPLCHNEALGIYSKLVAEKQRGGYTPGKDGTPYQHTEIGKRDTGFRHQLLNPDSEDNLPTYINDPAYAAQEKFNGKRLGLEYVRGILTASNKKGLAVAVPETIASTIGLFGKDLSFDGEIIGDEFKVFDITAYNGKDLLGEPLSGRLVALADIFAQHQFQYFVLAETAYTTKEKEALLSRLRKGNAEGIVFKRLDAVYTAGRPASGGSQIKIKFYAEATCIVAKINKGKRSVALEMVVAGPIVGERISVGNCAIPANKDIPKPGAFVEIRYLYAHKGGALYQPFYKGERDDVDEKDCAIEQLKYKPEGED